MSAAPAAGASARAMAARSASAARRGRRRRRAIVTKGAPCMVAAASAPRREIHVQEFAVQDGMLLVAQHPRPDELVALARDVQPPRPVDLHLPRHLEEE